MTKEEAVKEIEKAFEPAFANYIITALTEGATVSDKEPNTWCLDDAREDFMHDVYNTLDFLPTNEEANRIIDIFDRVTSSIEQEPILDKIRERVERLQKVCDKDDLNWQAQYSAFGTVLDIIDKYKAESEDKG